MEITAVGQSQAFEYTGAIQSFTVPISGIYKLEAYGGQGGKSPRGDIGGCGGYTCGEIKLKKGDILYVCVGGRGTDSYINASSPLLPGGYNGGGYSQATQSDSGGYSGAGSGGGATHFGLKNKILKEYESTAGLLLVAGGGGSGSNWYCWTEGKGYWVEGLAGLNGNADSNVYESNFGYSSVQGGGGLYGGRPYGGSPYSASTYPSSGGQGYVGDLTNGYIEESEHTGNGYAVITLMKKGYMVYLGSTLCSNILLGSTSVMDVLISAIDRPVYAVTYIVDRGVSYQEDVTSGASCLNPTSFTPSKEGWEFIGWRDNIYADKDVLSSKVMGSAEVTLYATYKQTVTGTFCSGENKANVQTITGTRYFNASGDVLNAAYTAPNGAELSGWTWRGWSASGATGATASVAYANGAAIAVWSDNTYYGLYQQTITVAYDGNGADSGSVASQSEMAYYNSAHNASYPSFTLAANGFSRAGYKFTAWTNNGVDTFAVGQTVPVYGDVVMYAMWEADVVAEPYSVELKSGVFTTEGDFEDYYSYLEVYPGQSVLWEFVLDTVGTGRIMAYGLETKGCNRVRIKWIEPEVSTYTLVGVTNVFKSGDYLYGTVSGDTVDIGISVTIPADLEETIGADSLEIYEISFYSE